MFAIESPESIPNPDGAAERLNKKEGKKAGRGRGRERKDWREGGLFI